MILTCPNCGTQYVVKDGAVPPEGRQVRCAACKHSWHQNPEGSIETETAPAPADDSDLHESDGPVEEAEPAATEEEGLAEATLIEPRSGPEAEERAYEEAVIEGEAAPPAEETGANTFIRPPETNAAVRQIERHEAGASLEEIYAEQVRQTREQASERVG